MRALRASASSLSVPVSRAISTLELRQRGRVLVIPDLEGDDAALPQPAQPLLGRGVLAGEPLHRLAAERDGRVVVVGEGDQRVQQQVGGRRLRRPVGAARPGRPAATSGIPTLPLSLAPNSAAENASTYVSRATEMSSGSSRRAAASRSGVASVPRLETNASCARSRSIRARWSSSSGPASAVASRPRAVRERAGLDAGLRGRQRAFTAPRRVRGQRDGALQEGGRGGDPAASLRPAGRALELGGDVLVRSCRRQCAVPRAAIGVGVRIAHLGEDLVHPLPAAERRGPVDRRAHERMAEPDARPDLQQLRGLGGRERAGLDVEPPARAQDQRRVTQGLGGRQQHQSLRRLGQLADAPEVVVLDVRRKLAGGRKLEATGQLGGGHAPWQLQQGERVPPGLGDDPVTDAAVEPAR